MNITPLTSEMILSISFLLVIAFYVYVNAVCGKRLRQHIKLEECSEEKIWIRPQSMKYATKLIFFYLLMVVICAGMVVATIQVGNTTVRFKK